MKRRQKYFYSHLVDLEPLFLELETLTLTKPEKKELADLAHMNLHQTVIDAVLSHLNENDKKKFLELLANGEDEKIWEHLNERVEKIEDKITEAAIKTQRELGEDVKKIKDLS